MFRFINDGIENYFWHDIGFLSNKVVSPDAPMQGITI